MPKRAEDLNTKGESSRFLHYSEKGSHRLRGDYWRSAASSSLETALPIELQQHIRRKMLRSTRDGRR